MGWVGGSAGWSVKGRAVQQQDAWVQGEAGKGGGYISKSLLELGQALGQAMSVGGWMGFGAGASPHGVQRWQERVWAPERGGAAENGQSGCRFKRGSRQARRSAAAPSRPRLFSGVGGGRVDHNVDEAAVLGSALGRPAPACP